MRTLIVVALLTLAPSVASALAVCTAPTIVGSKVYKFVGASNFGGDSKYIGSVTSVPRADALIADGCSLDNTLTVLIGGDYTADRGSPSVVNIKDMSFSMTDANYHGIIIAGYDSSYSLTGIGPMQVSITDCNMGSRAGIMFTNRFPPSSAISVKRNTIQNTLRRPTFDATGLQFIVEAAVQRDTSLFFHIAGISEGTVITVSDNTFTYTPQATLEAGLISGNIVVGAKAARVLMEKGSRLRIEGNTMTMVIGGGAPNAQSIAAQDLQISPGAEVHILKNTITASSNKRIDVRRLNFATRGVSETAPPGAFVVQGNTFALSPGASPAGNYALFISRAVGADAANNAVPLPGDSEGGFVVFENNQVRDFATPLVVDWPAHNIAPAATPHIFSCVRNAFSGANHQSIINFPSAAELTTPGSMLRITQNTYTLGIGVSQLLQFQRLDMAKGQLQCVGNSATLPNGVSFNPANHRLAAAADPLLPMAVAATSSGISFCKNEIAGHPVEATVDTFASMVLPGSTLRPFCFRCGCAEMGDGQWCPERPYCCTVTSDGVLRTQCDALVPATMVYTFPHLDATTITF